MLMLSPLLTLRLAAPVRRGAVLGAYELMVGGIFLLAVNSVSRQYSGVDLVGATAAVVLAHALGAAISPALLGYPIELAPRYGFAATMSMWRIAAMLGFERYARGAAPRPFTAGELR